MPQMGESVTEGTVLEWHVSEGEVVAEGETVVEVSTDKVDAEVPAPGQRRDHQDPQGRRTRRSRSAPVLAELDPTRRAVRQRRRAPTSAKAAARRPPAEGDPAGASGEAAAGERRQPPRRRANPPTPDAQRERCRRSDRRLRRSAVVDRDARDGRVGHRGHGPRMARGRGRGGRRGRDRGRGLDRQGRRRGAGPGAVARSPSFWSSPTTTVQVGQVLAEMTRRRGRADGRAPPTAGTRRLRSRRPAAGATDGTAAPRPSPAASPPQAGVDLGVVQRLGAGRQGDEGRRARRRRTARARRRPCAAAPTARPSRCAGPRRCSPRR